MVAYLLSGLFCYKTTDYKNWTWNVKISFIAATHANVVAYVVGDHPEVVRVRRSKRSIVVHVNEYCLRNSVMCCVYTMDGGVKHSGWCEKVLVRKCGIEAGTICVFGVRTTSCVRRATSRAGRSAVQNMWTCRQAAKTKIPVFAKMGRLI